MRKPKRRAVTADPLVGSSHLGPAPLVDRLPLDNFDVNDNRHTNLHH